MHNKKTEKFLFDAMNFVKAAAVEIEKAVDEAEA